MLDPVLRRHTERATAPIAARLAGFHPLALTLAAFVCGVVAMLDVGHRNYIIGLVFLVAARLFDALDGPLARRKGATAFGAYLDRVLSLVAGTGLAFAFALAAPDRALAAMFLMLGLATRAGAGADAGKTELFVAFAVACLLPDWFSVIAYFVGILCFVEAGTRVAAEAVRRA